MDGAMDTACPWMSGLVAHASGQAATDGRTAWDSGRSPSMPGAGIVWQSLVCLQVLALHPKRRCAHCAEFTQRINKCRRSPDQGREEEKTVLKAHLDMVKSWPLCQTRLNRLSVAATREGTVSNADAFIKIDLDGCDEAKFRTPRNVQHPCAARGAPPQHRIYLHTEPGEISPRRCLLPTCSADTHPQQVAKAFEAYVMAMEGVRAARRHGTIGCCIQLQLVLGTRRIHTAIRCLHRSLFTYGRTQKQNTAAVFLINAPVLSQSCSGCPKSTDSSRWTTLQPAAIKIDL